MPPHRPRIPWYVRLQRAPGRLLNLLADLGAKLVWPIERAFAALGRLGLAIAERFENLESVGLWIGRILAWPFRMLWSPVAGLACLLVPESVRNLLAAPFRGLGSLGTWTGHALMRLAEALNLDGVVLRLVRWSWPLWYPFAAIAGFLQAWLASRDYKQLLWGLPAAIAIVPVLGAVTWTKIWDKGGVAADYRVAVKAALDEKDFNRVQLYERKLAQLGADNRMTDFQTATVLGNEGQMDEAYERMQLLAPLDAPGFAPGHAWIVDQLLLGKLGLTADESQRLMRIHLDHLRTLGARGPDFDFIEAVWLLRAGRKEDAADAFRPLVNRNPLAAVLRMELDLELGRIEEARGDARAVRTHMQDRQRRGVDLAAQDYRSWTVAENLLGNAEQMETNVRAWLKLEPNNLEAKQKLSELCLRRFEVLIATPDPDPRQLAELFIEAAELKEDPKALQRQVAWLYRQRDRIPAARQVIELVAGSPRTHSAILEAAGSAAAAAGNLSQAKTYLEEAVARDPHNPIAWNNYAYVLLQDEKADLERALDAVNKALAIEPDAIYYRETRGQILVRLGKWEEAIADLEFAANGMPASREVHWALATAYDGIGDPELARIHREQAR